MGEEDHGEVEIEEVTEEDMTVVVGEGTKFMKTAYWNCFMPYMSSFGHYRYAACDQLKMLVFCYGVIAT